MATQQPELKLEIRAIYLADTRTVIAPDFDPTMGGQQLDGQIRTAESPMTMRLSAPTADFPLRSVTFLNSFEFRYSGVLPAGSGEASNPTTVASVNASIATNYALPEGQNPSEEQLLEFGRSAAMWHAWPYWREFCHSLLLRMHLPPVVMPLLRVEPSHEEKIVPTTPPAPRKRKIKAPN